MVHTFFIDLDNTLYPKSSGLMDAIRDRIISYMKKILNLDDKEIKSIREYSLKKYGTTLIGLMELYGIDKHHYLDYVHDLDLDIYLKPNPELLNILNLYPQKKVIFSNADQNHIRRVLEFLDLVIFFDVIIDVHMLMPSVKPQAAAFQKAKKAVGLKTWQGCAFIDDYYPNIQKAEELGIFSILIDEKDDVEYKQKIPSILDLPKVINQHIKG